MTEEEKSILRPFLDEHGRLTAFPAKRKKKLAALHFLAEKFPDGERWTEQQVNDRLLEWHTFHDPATLRRELYNAHLLNRTPDGGTYWRENTLL